MIHIGVYPTFKTFFSCYSYGMNQIIEDQTAEMLLLAATDSITSYYDSEDWDAGIVAVLARALELASGRKLKSLEDIWTTTTFT